MDSIPLLHCLKCNQDKPETDFSHHRDGRIRFPCKECRRAYENARYIPHPTAPPPPPPGYKRCPHCEQELLANTDFFYSNKGKPDELSTLCKPCHRKYELARHEQPKLTPPETLVCRECGEEKPATPKFFNRMKANIYGLNTVCGECTAAAKRKPSPYEPAPPGYKRCRQCLEAIPATPEFFRTSRFAKDGLRNQCKACRRIRRRKPLPHKSRKRKPAPVGDKKCIGCGNFFPRTLEYFYPSTTARDRLQSRCKKCCNKLTRQNDKSHPDETRVRRNRYYAAHKAEFAKRRYKYSHSERGRAVLRTVVLNRIARKKAAKGTHTPIQIREQYSRQHGRCYYCQKKIKWGEHHVDHTFPLSRENGDAPINSIDYLVITCQPCNQSKHDKYPWEWPEGGRLL